VALIKSIGLGLAAAVFFDAFVVRMTVVPAVMALLGRRAWALPAWLDRILPNVDVEGERLRRALAAERAGAAEQAGDPVHADAGISVPPSADPVLVGAGGDGASADTTEPKNSALRELGKRLTRKN
jgi:hypothetical protein